MHGSDVCGIHGNHEGDGMGCVGLEDEYHVCTLRNSVVIVGAKNTSRSAQFGHGQCMKTYYQWYNTALLQLLLEPLHHRMPLIYYMHINIMLNSIHTGRLLERYLLSLSWMVTVASLEKPIVTLLSSDVATIVAVYISSVSKILSSNVGTTSVGVLWPDWNVTV